MKVRQSLNNFDFNIVYNQLAVRHFESLEKEGRRGPNASYSISDACKSR